MTAPAHFHERLREDLVREIQWTIGNRLRDPRITAVVTVTDLELSSDTRNATVYVSVFGESRQQESALIALNRAAPFIQKSVAERVSARHFPRFYFKIDHSIERSMRINELLKEVKDDLDRPPVDPP